MNTPVYSFQEVAVDQLLKKVDIAHQIDDPSRCISFTAPTGASKTIMMIDFIEKVFAGAVEFKPDSEKVFAGTVEFKPDPDAVFIWLSDSPELNKQTFDKMLAMSDKINPAQLCLIESTFDAEELTAGTVYFLNTQKLGKDNKLVTKGDDRQWTIWETFANTAATQKKHLYVIIDEAHRGALKGTKNGLPIMQRFVKGSPADGMVPMPVVIGVTATPKRFEDLIAGAPFGSDKVTVPIQDVRDSGLLKERILLRKQETEIRADKALFESAVDEWIEVTESWADYCASEGVAPFKPLLVVQVENESGGKVTATNLSMCYQVLEEKLGRPLSPGEAVHTFPGAGELAVPNGVIREIEASKIQDDESAIVVFFKENLSTGWDCPRAETLVSFRTALDETYIAQILGRMIRTPLRRRVEAVPRLNDVSLFVPYFDDDSTQKLLKALEGELQIDVTSQKDRIACKRNPEFSDVFDALATKHTYSIDKAKKQPYLKLAMELAAQLTWDGLASGLRDKVLSAIVDKFGAELLRMKDDGSYGVARDAVVQAVTKTIEITNPAGGAQVSVGQNVTGYVSDYDVDAAFDDADRRLGIRLGTAYLVRRSDENLKDVKIDAIVLLKDMATVSNLEDFAKDRFEKNYTKYQAQIAKLDEGKKSRYARMVRSAATPVPRLLDNLPQAMDAVRNAHTVDHDRHLYCDASGKFPVRLTGWEEATLKHERDKTPGFHAWLRNCDRKPWSFAIPYEMKGEPLPMYPDFIVARKVDGKIVLDILEPHRDDASDNWPKAVGLAKYANRHSGEFGRILLIREVSVAGIKTLKALDMANLTIRNKVLPITTDAQLNAIFESDGSIMN